MPDDEENPDRIYYEPFTLVKPRPVKRKKRRKAKAKRKRKK